MPGEPRNPRAELTTCPECGSLVWAERHKLHLDYEPAPLSLIGAGINAAMTIRLISGNTDQRYTPTEVAVMVAEVVESQLARFTVGGSDAR